MDDAGIVERLLADPRLLRLPLVRYGNEVTAGRAEATWAALAQPAGGALSAVTATTAPHDDAGPPRRRPSATSSIMKPGPRMTPDALADPDEPDEDEHRAMIQRDAHRRPPGAMLARWMTTTSREDPPGRSACG